MTVESRTRPTIMDGQVTMWARAFQDEGTGLLRNAKALGPFEVSASRNAVMVHRADLRTSDDFEDFAEAFACARRMFEQLGR